MWLLGKSRAKRALTIHIDDMEKEQTIDMDENI
jgi:hypothetical protein